jgi:hypothetical protein
MESEAQVMQAKDIPDEGFLDYVWRHNVGELPDYFGRMEPHWGQLYDTAEFMDVPWKVVKAKAASLMRRRLMDGCPCGCRGDYNIPYTPVSWGFIEEEHK